MGWSLGYKPFECTELQDEFFAILGRSLYVASEFEHKCSFIVQIIQMVDIFDSEADTDSAWALVKALRPEPLGRATSRIALHVSESDVEALTRARNARNYVAHEAGRLGFIPSLRDDALLRSKARLKEEIYALAQGDNVVSAMIYSIEEKDLPPSTIRAEYCDWLQNWVFWGRHLT